MQIKSFRQRRVHFSKRFPTQQAAGPVTEDLVYSTPRSEIQNPMADQELLEEAKTSKDTEVPKRRRTSVSSAKLKRADPKDLPSYPSHGLANFGAAGRAAFLAASSSKSPEPWRPDSIPAAGTAASLANSIKSPEPWKSGPLPNAAAAALLAGDSRRVPDAWQPVASPSASKAASSVKDRKPEPKRSPPQNTPNALAAAGLANQSPRRAAKTVSTSPTTPAYDINKINAVASQNAQTTLSSSSQPRSLPTQSQTEKNMTDVLGAAKASMAKNLSKSPPNRPTSTATTAMPPGSYYSHIPTSPPKPSTKESGTSKLNRQSSMAAASVAATSDLHSVISDESVERQVKYYPYLEEAARKAASERLARLQAEHDRARKASGLPPSWQPAGPHTRSITSPKQPRTNTKTQPRSQPRTTQPPRTTKPPTKSPAVVVPPPKKKPDAVDFARSMKIKADTAKLSRQIDAVDKDRQARDYLALMAVAEKNVKSRMQDLETKVAEDQGRVPKHLQAQWDAKARMLSEEYERKRNADQESKKGKINMGGGLWYDKEDLDRIARGNVQPILDEINVKAEKERARLEALRLDKEAQDKEKREAAEKVAETKAETKKTKALVKAQAKSRREAEKAEERLKKAEFKESQRQEKERLKAEKEQQKLAAVAAAVPVPPSPDEVPQATEEPEEEAQQEEAPVPAPVVMPFEIHRTASEMEELEPRPMSQAGHERVDREREMHEAAKKEKGWFGSLQQRLTRRKPGVKKDDKEHDVGVDGGMEHPDHQGYEADEVSSISSPEHDSVRHVALAGTGALSDLSSSDEEEEAEVHTATLGRRYALDSDSSSTSSGDLYTTSPNYNTLTSATYNPTEGEELVMQAFIEGPVGRRYSTSSDDSSDLEEEEAAIQDKTFGEIHDTEDTGGVSLHDHEEKKEAKLKDAKDEDEQSSSRVSVEKHGTFGAMLATKVKTSFEEYSKEEVEKEEQKEKQEAKEMNIPAVESGVVPAEKTTVPITEITPPSPMATQGNEKQDKEDKEDEFHQARDDFSDVGKSDAGKDDQGSLNVKGEKKEKKPKRSSRFSEIL
ncbi:hypothetical protein H072_2866 [Dactylellina haptotyla CBS 200.50]|uniref:Eisosome protein 1 n=1 Tax=Dactylellina haptotyla (strain CBS 200.50) TaxID=1284197 RepID=S8AJP2_DACHA|nr:hypothetical protein H072_2866 [Dactylellina haptotyla CBS 200.50]